MPQVHSLNSGVFPHAEAERCVACGLCLPHCPTYLNMRTENESPRGRIALMRAWSSGSLPLTPTLEAHLSRCLVCRACEDVCPSGVPFGHLMDTTRALIADKRPRRLRRFLFHRLLLHPSRVRLLARFLRLYQISGLQGLLHATGLLRLAGWGELDRALPRLPPQRPWKKIHPPAGVPRGRLSLFTGCVGAAADRETLESAIAVLNRLGYEVVIPPDQVCCGALPLHAGETKSAHALMHANLRAFNDTRTTPILSCVSGCGATLADYGKNLPQDSGAETFAGRVQDISQFLAHADWPPDVRFEPRRRRVAIHDPCTLTHVARRQDMPHRLLARLPGAEIIPLPGNRTCCGAAGTYFITHSHTARALRADKLEQLRRLAPDILVTSNVGCALHLAAGIKEEGLDIPVVHPVTLLNRMLSRKV